MERPRIKIYPDNTDWLIELISALFLILMIGFPVYYYNALPETIPRHYDALGQPDGFSQKSVIWTLPAIGLLMFTGLTLLNRYPHLFNYPADITKENASRQYKIATKLVRILKMLISAAFFYISYSTVMTALGKQYGLGRLFLPFFLIVLSVVIGFYIYKAAKTTH